MSIPRALMGGCCPASPRVCAVATNDCPSLSMQGMRRRNCLGAKLERYFQPCTKTQCVQFVDGSSFDIESLRAPSVM